MPLVPSKGQRCDCNGTMDTLGDSPFVYYINWESILLIRASFDSSRPTSRLGGTLGRNRSESGSAGTWDVVALLWDPLVISVVAALLAVLARRELGCSSLNSTAHLGSALRGTSTD